jgi:cardiolipin synthase
MLARRWRASLAAAVWLRPEDGVFLLVMMLVAGATDLLDGWIGRRTHPRARTGLADVGAWLDPVCDKVFTVSTAAAIVVTWDPPVVVVVLLLLRDVALAVLTIVFRLVAGRERFAAHDYRATPSGKATTVLQFATLLAILFAPRWAVPSAWLCGFVGALAVVERVVLATRPAARGREA